MTQVIDFFSVQCRDKEHNSCYGSWSGLGFQFNCDCSCHKLKDDTADGFQRSDSTASDRIWLEVTKENDQ